MRPSQLLALAALLALAPSTWGYLISDDQPAMTWDDLLACKLVVVGHYDSHAPGILNLKVDRVLCSPSDQPVKAGDLLQVGLEHWWSVETGPVGMAGMMKDAVGDGKPRICYKAQYMNPGPLVPEPILDSGQSAVFFFPLRQAALKRSLQIQPLAHADAWQQALDGKPIELSFRLTQKLNDKLHRDAIEEFRTSRDARIIAQLIERIAAGLQWDRSGWPGDIYQPLELLTAIGDGKGDVYDPARAEIEKAMTRKTLDSAYEFAYVMARVDPERAFKELRPWIERPPQPDYRKVALAALGWVGNEESLNLAIDWMNDPDAGQFAMISVNDLLGDQTLPGPNFPKEQTARLWAAAKKRVTGLTLPENLSVNARAMYRKMIDTELKSDGLPK